jgi:hypothetical protein
MNMAGRHKAISIYVKSHVANNQHQSQMDHEASPFCDISSHESQWPPDAQTRNRGPVRASLSRNGPMSSMKASIETAERIVPHGGTWSESRDSVHGYHPDH